MINAHCAVQTNENNIIFSSRKVEMKELADYVDEIEQGVLTAYVSYGDHRGETPLPYGWISMSDYELGKKARLRRECKNQQTSDIAWDAFGRIIDELRVVTGKLEFRSSYIEFLYPGSPGYGFSLTMPYASAMPLADFREDYGAWYPSDAVRRAYEKHKKIVSAYNAALAELEDGIVSRKEEIGKETYSEEYEKNII